MSIRAYSNEELEKELQRRENEIPEFVANIDWSKVLKYVKDEIEFIGAYGFEHKDFEHELFETVIETIYGKDVWKWWNKHT